MERYAVIEKQEGETPLQALERYRSAYPALARVPLTYAGRLDPMATGLLVILIGEECKNRDSYTGLDKEYEFEILFGARTDTGDVLGVMEEYAITPPGLGVEEAIQEGSFTLPYPSYSSKTVDGIPLHVHARAGKLQDIRIPTRLMEIKSAAFIGTRSMSGAVIRSDVAQRVGLLRYDVHGPARGDFRESQVLKSWEDFPDGTYIVARYRALVSEGTYIRSLIAEVGKRLSVPTLAYSIRRTRIIGLP